MGLKPEKAEEGISGGPMSAGSAVSSTVNWVLSGSWDNCA
jgi:hypothetical protein